MINILFAFLLKIVMFRDPLVDQNLKMNDILTDFRHSWSEGEHI